MFARLTPANWLLAAVAAWALGVAIVALSGFGGRYRLHPEDSSLAPGLPTAAVQASQSPLGPLELYAEAANRPLFYPDRKPTRAKVASPADTQQPLSVVLTSIIITPTLRMAIVHDNTSNKSLGVREGQPLQGGPAGWRLVSVSRRQAVFEGGQGQTTLDLRVFDGQGGEPPTPNGLNPQAVAALSANTVPANPALSNPGPLNPAALNPVQANSVQPGPPQTTSVPSPGVPSPSVPSGPIEPNGMPPGILGPMSGSPPRAEDASVDAEHQAAQIRQRIEARRRQALNDVIPTPPPTQKGP